MHRTFYAFFALMAIIGISSTAIESAKNTAYGSQRSHRSSQIHDRDWEFVKFQGDHMVFADIGGDPTDQRLGAHPIEVDVANNVAPAASIAPSSGTSEPIDYAAIDAGADPITGETYGCGLGQPIEPVAVAVAIAKSVKPVDPFANVCPVGLPSNYCEPNVAEVEASENELAESTQPVESADSDPYLDWDCGAYLRQLAADSDQRANGWPASEVAISANESTPAADYTLSNPAASEEAVESPRVPLAAQQLQEGLRFECPEFVLEYLRQFSTAMDELENYAPARVDAESRIAKEYAAAENAAALAELHQANEVVAATQSVLSPLPVDQCNRPEIAYNELGYPSCGGYSPNWQNDDSTLSLATESNLASTMKIESVDPVIDPADDRWIGPEANLPQADVSEAKLIDKVDGPLPALPRDLEVERPEDSNSLANLMRLIVTIDPNLKLQDFDPSAASERENSTIVENGLWSGCDSDFPGCHDAGEPIVTHHGWTKEELALDDEAQLDDTSNFAEQTKLEFDPIFAWIGERMEIAWNWGTEALASLHRQSDDVSSARANWSETR